MKQAKSKGKSKAKGPPKAREARGEGSGPVILPPGYASVQSGVMHTAEALMSGLAAQRNAETLTPGVVSHPFLGVGDLHPGQGYLPLANARVQQAFDMNIPQDGLPSLANLPGPWNQQGPPQR